MSKSVLIVDDEELLREVFRESFEDHGFQVDEAGNGEEGLKKMNETKYDLVLSDIRMPVCNGIDMYRKMQETGFDELPVILITGYSDYDVSQLMSLGVSKVFFKPINYSKLFDFIENKLFSEIAS